MKWTWVVGVAMCPPVHTGTASKIPSLKVSCVTPVPSAFTTKMSSSPSRRTCTPSSRRKVPQLTVMSAVCQDGTIGSVRLERPRPDRPRMAPIAWDDFAKVDIRVGRIVQADDFPKARKPAYQLRIDFGELGVKTSSAQIMKYYEKNQLVGKLVLAVVNFPPRQIANFFSEVLTLGVVLGDGDIVLVHPEREVPLGSRIA